MTHGSPQNANDEPGRWWQGTATGERLDVVIMRLEQLDHPVSDQLLPAGIIVALELKRRIPLILRAFAARKQQKTLHGDDRDGGESADRYTQ